MVILSIVILSLSSLLLTMVGISRAANPIKNYLKNSGIVIAEDINLLSETRGIGALMALGGIVIASGMFIPELTLTSHVVASLIFLGYAIGRLVSLGTDGKPNSQIKVGLISELVLGPVNLFCLIMTLV